MKLLMAALAAASLTGCVFVAVAAVAAAVGVGTYMYLDNELSYEYEMSLDTAWEASRKALKAVELTIVDERRDFQEGILTSRMADNRQVRVTCERLGDARTRVRVRVGDFSGEANRQAAQTIHEEIAQAQGLRPPPLPPADRTGSDEMQKMYKADVSECFDAALKACEAQGYKAVKTERRGDERGTISAEGKGAHAYVTVSRHEKRTRVIVQVRGGATDQNKKDAKALHGALGKVLGESGED